MPRPFVRILVLAVLAMASSACGRTETKRPPAPPAIFDLSGFPDIPIPPGYQLHPRHDHLALSLANGSIRQLECTLIKTNDRIELADAKAVAWYAGRVEAVGWQPRPHAHEERREWTRQRVDAGRERLRIETGRDGKQPIIRLLLAPQDGA